MDMLPDCYVSYMRLFPDRPDVLVKGRWHWSPVGAKALPFAHAFGSFRWDSDQYAPFTPTVGEIPGRRGRTRGEADPRLLGLNHCGDPDVWLHGVPFDQAGTPAVDAEGVPFCCLALPPLPGGVLVGGDGLDAVGGEVEGGDGMPRFRAAGGEVEAADALPTWPAGGGEVEAASVVVGVQITGGEVEGGGWLLAAAAGEREAGDAMPTWTAAGGELEGGDALPTWPAGGGERDGGNGLGGGRSRGGELDGGDVGAATGCTDTPIPVQMIARLVGSGGCAAFSVNQVFHWQWDAFFEVQWEWTTGLAINGKVCRVSFGCNAGAWYCKLNDLSDGVAETLAPTTFTLDPISFSFGPFAVAGAAICGGSFDITVAP